MNICECHIHNASPGTPALQLFFFVYGSGTGDSHATDYCASWHLQTPIEISINIHVANTDEMSINIHVRSTLFQSKWVYGCRPNEYLRVVSREPPPLATGRMRGGPTASFAWHAGYLYRLLARRRPKYTNAKPASISAIADGMSIARATTCHGIMAGPRPKSSNRWRWGTRQYGLGL